jgi:cytochrome c-type biogenesis protein CcmH/NrfG
MARAAVKAKQAQAQKTQARAKGRSGGRRKHAAGGNPNQQLFFSRLRRKAKFAYLLLAILFAITFAFLGVGSGSSGLDQLFSGLNIFSSGGSSVSKAESEIKKLPNDPKGYTDLATAYEAKGDTGNAISALQQLTTRRPKNVAAWTELAGLQLTQAQTYVTQYQAAFQNQQLAAPSQSFQPTGKLATAIGTNPIEQAAAATANTATNNFYSQATITYSDAIASYKQLVKLEPANANAQFQLAQAAQTAGDTTTAIAAYKAYLKLNPDSSTAAQVKALIKQLTPAPTPAKKKSGK